MTLREACERRIPRVRLAAWANPNAYIRLPLFESGYGPWAELYDEWGQQACDIPVGSQRICVLLEEHNTIDDFEVYSGPAHSAEAMNFASAYKEGGDA